MSREQDPNDQCAGDRSGRPGCGFAPLERLRFWNGRFLVARDLRHQQDDLVRRLEYHQRAAHGEGILCGFGIRRHPRDECERDWLVVETGMAYDCCGRTLWMPEARPVRIPPGPVPHGQGEGGELAETNVPATEYGREDPGDPAEWSRGERPAERGGGAGGRDDGLDRDDREQGHPHGRPPGGGQGPGQGTGSGQGQGHGNGPGHGHGPGHGPGPGGPGEGEPERLPDPRWFIAARWVEHPTDPQPALYADDLCEPVRHEHGRLREEVELRVLAADQVSHACWPRWQPVTGGDCTDEVDDDCHVARGDTIPCGQECACGDWVVLAGVWRDARGRLRWDTTHRRVLIPPAGLTRITGVNWPHGGDLPLSRLRGEMDGQLVVRFSRRLRPAEGFRRGINPMTFQVAYLGQQGSWEEVLPPEQDEQGVPTPRLSRNGRCAVFDIPRELLGGRRGIAGHWVRVRLLGDFIVDCHGRAVSAAHTGGDVNGRGSGNGVPGGTFESWFYVRNTWKEDER